MSGKGTKEMTFIDRKKATREVKNRLVIITRHKRSDYGKLRSWIAKAITREKSCENQITNTISKRNENDRL